MTEIFSAEKRLAAVQVINLLSGTLIAVDITGGGRFFCLLYEGWANLYTVVVLKATSIIKNT